MRLVQGWLSKGTRLPGSETFKIGMESVAGTWTTKLQKLNLLRMRDELFGYIVTNQLTDNLGKNGLPFVWRFIFSKNWKKKVLSKDEVKSAGHKGERELMERIMKEVSLPQYELFEDYNEMVMQFGYVVLWSTVFPLAPCASFLSLAT